MQQALVAKDKWKVVEFPEAADLPIEDGEPLESAWHRAEISLLIDSLTQAWGDRTDYYTGGNMFVYFSAEQVRSRDYRGPDFFVVKGVEGTVKRDAWIVWQENGRYPDLIIELLSPSTAELDRTTKKRLYERTFRTPEYFGYDPVEQELFGWRLADGEYIPLEKDENGRLWSKELQFWLGLWEGKYQNLNESWLRYFDEDGQVVPTVGEAAEREISRLREELARLKKTD
jgi:Uma2 family endonuclease